MSNFIEQNSVNGKNQCYLENTKQSNHGVVLPLSKPNENNSNQTKPNQTTTTDQPKIQTQPSQASKQTPLNMKVSSILQDKQDKHKKVVSWEK